MSNNPWDDLTESLPGPPPRAEMPVAGLRTRGARPCVVAVLAAMLLVAGCNGQSAPASSPSLDPTSVPATAEPTQTPADPVTETGEPVETASPEPAETVLDPDTMAPFPEQVGEFVNDPVGPLNGFYTIPGDPDSPTISTNYDPMGAHGEWAGSRDDEWIDDVWYCGSSAGGMRFCDTQIAPERGALVVMGFDEAAMLAFADELLAVWPYEGFR